TEHEGCGGEVERLLSPPALQFKGSGWDVTDYARNGQSNSSANGKNEPKPADTSKSESKTESKPASSPSSSPTPAKNTPPAAPSADQQQRPKVNDSPRRPSPSRSAPPTPSRNARPTDVRAARATCPAPLKMRPPRARSGIPKCGSHIRPTSAS